MDILYFLKMRTDFVRYFYRTAVSPFHETKRAIKNGEAPYIPPYSEDGEPPFLAEWMEAQEGAEAVAYAAISMLSSSLHLFLKAWFNRMPAIQELLETINFKKHGWFNGYVQALRELGLNPEDSEIDLDVLEQLSLARNRVQHPERLTELGVDHSDRDLEKFPAPFFADEAEMKMLNPSEETDFSWWLKPSVRASDERLMTAADQVERFCAWLEREHRSARRA